MWVSKYKKGIVSLIGLKGLSIYVIVKVLGDFVQISDQRKQWIGTLVEWEMGYLEVNKISQFINISKIKMHNYIGAEEKYQMNFGDG